MKKLLTLNLLLLISIGAIIAQTGPGGVGNKNGASGQPINSLWFSANSLSLADNAPVSGLLDISGNSNNASQPTANQQPKFRTAQINGLPVIYFDPAGGAGNQDFMPFDGTQIANTDYTIFIVMAKRSTGAKWVMGGTTSDANQNLHFGWQNDTLFKYHQWGNDLTDAHLTPAAGGTAIGTYGIFTLICDDNDPNNDRRIYQNNIQIGQGATPTHLTSYFGAGIGGVPAINSYSDVNVAEVIFFSTALNNAQIQIVNQYLNVKYGISITNDLYNPDASYTTNVAGIGEEANGEHSLASSSGFYLKSLSGLGISDYIFTSNNNLPNNVADFSTSDIPSGVDLRYNRIWNIKKINSPDAQFSFDFNEASADSKFPVNYTNYCLLYRSSTSGVFSIVKNADGISDGDRVYFNLTNAEIQDGYYTFGTTDQVNSPLGGASGRIWYSLISDNWDNWETWTLDPSGALPNNPEHLTPTTSPTSSADKVVVMNGKTVTLSSNNKINASLTVDGRLDIDTTHNHSFGEIRGSGIILMKGDFFPAGDATHFVTEGQGEGKVVYEGGSYNLSTARTFFDVDVNLSANTNIITLLNDYNINGTLTINQGNFRFNDDTSKTILNLTVNKNVLIQSNGSISVGHGRTISTYNIGNNNVPTLFHSIFHQFNIYGDFVNNGIAKFTNLTVPDYNHFDSTGAVTVTFKGASNNNITLNNTTWFYNLIIDKGTDKTYIANLFSSETNNFVLFGSNSVGRTNVGGFSDSDPQIRKALFIKKGTLKLTGKVYIPTLSEGMLVGGNGDYAIGQNARLWIAGPDVTVYTTASNVSQIPNFTVAWVQPNTSNQAMSVYGEFRISDGFFGTRNSAGFIFWAAANAQVKIEGGISDVSQFRGGQGAGVASYIQTGGQLIVRGNQTEAGEVANTYPLFGFDDSTGVFIMSGGEILLRDVAGTNTNGFYLPSAEGNYDVTGGKVTIEIASGNDFEIGSNAPIWDLEIKRLSGTNTALVRLTHNLTILNNLTINNFTNLDVQDDLDSHNYDLSIGGNLDLQDGGQYTARTNTTSFIGSKNSIIYVRNISNSNYLKFHNLAISKDQYPIITQFYNVAVNSSGRTETIAPIEIQNNFTINRGSFDYKRWYINIEGNIEIIDGKIADSDNPHGCFVLDGTITQTFRGAFGKEQTFGNYILNNANGAKLLSDINVTNFVLTSGLMNLDIYNLDVAGTVSTTGTYSPTLMFSGAGQAGNGGLTLFVNFSKGISNTTTLFPIGSVGQYTPAKIIQESSVNDSGKITITPVNAYHPATSDSTKTIPYYWIVSKTGFTTLTYTNLKYTFTYPGTMPPSQNKGCNLYDLDYQWYEFNNVTNGHDIEFPYEAYLSGDFTLGNKSVFNAPEIYYSRYTNGYTGKYWDDPTSWSTVGFNGTAASNAPHSYDIVKIGYGGGDAEHNHHYIIVKTNVSAALVIFVPNPNVGQRDGRIAVSEGCSVNFTRVMGQGEFNVFVKTGLTTTVNGDFQDFANHINSTFMYKSIDNAVHVLPSSYPKVYPNLSIEMPGTFIFPFDVTVNGYFNTSGGNTLQLSNTTNGDFYVYGDFKCGGYLTGKILFPNSDTARTVSVLGNVLIGWIHVLNYQVNNDCSISVQTGGTKKIVHTLKVGGNIQIIGGNQATKDGIFNLFTNNTGGTNVNLELIGDSSRTFSNLTARIPSLYRLTVNKTEGKSFTFQNAFTLGDTNNGTKKSLELISGTLNLNNAGIDLTLSSGGANFKIPQQCSLNTEFSTLRVSGNNTGIWLDGSMTVGNSSNWLINEGNNNYIEYTASGSSAIIINASNATLKVGSQIRRATSTEEGVLDFQINDNTSTVILGTDNSIPENNRGVFEILNSGSNFVMAPNTKIIIANAQTSATFPSVYLAPETYSLGSGSEIQFGDINTRTNQTIGLFSDITLQNISTNNASGNKPNLKIWYKDLVINENVTIAANTQLNSDNWNLTINGNWTNNGTYLPVENTTFFSGSSSQNINGATNFYNFQKTATNLVNVNSNINVQNEFHINNGILADNSNEISVYGNLYNYGTHVWGGTGDGVKIIGTQQQEMFTTGIWGKITINNASGLLVTTAAPTINIKNAVKLVNGVFNIGKNLLCMDTNAVFIEANPYSNLNMIQTNLSFTDNGVKKTFSSSYTGNFVFPIGAGGKYAPVEMNISSTGQGTIRVVAANETHPTIIEDVEECTPNIVDSLNVLHFYWTVSTDITNFNAEITMLYDTADAFVTTPYAYTDYITAKLILGTTFWNKFDYNSFDENNHRLHFYFTDADKTNINGDFTAGVQRSCGGAIPDSIPIYISINNGDWTDKTNWDTYPIAGGTVPTGGPRGAIAIIDDPHTIIMNHNYLSNYKTTINGILNVGLSYGQRLGNVDGDGEIYVERGELPAAIYDNFILPNTGTFHFSGTDSYDVLSQLPIVNNLKFSGTGNRRLPNLDIIIRGNFIIDGTDNTLAVINEHNRQQEVKNNIVFNAGTFEAGTGTGAIFIIDGTNAQTISGTGSFTGSSAFNYFVMNNSYGLTLQKPIDIDQTLTLTNGVIFNNGVNVLRLTNPIENAVIGTSTASYVDGTVSKNVQTHTNFIFPIGNSGRLGICEINNASQTNSYDYWTGRYFNYNPNTDGYNPDNFYTPLQYVSHNEYWQLNGPAGSSSYVKLRWDAQSGVSSNASERDSMRVAEWKTNRWEQSHTNNTASGTSTSGTVTTATTLVPLVGNHYFTLATKLITDNIWQGDVSTDWFTATNWSLGSIPTSTTNATIPNPTSPAGGFYPVINGTTTATTLDLTIQNSATLTINPASSLTLSGALSNNGTIYIKSPANNTASGSFIDNGNISGSGTVHIERYMIGGEYHYVGSPINGGNATSALFTRSNPSGNYNYNFYYYDETTDLNGNPATAPSGPYNIDSLVGGWFFANNGPLGANVAMQPKTGYAFYTDMNQLITFIGTPNTGNQTISGLTNTSNDYINEPNLENIPQLYDGWCLVSNPYPSFIDWDLIKTGLVNMDEGIYVWDGNQYANYVNGISSGSGHLSNLVSPTQAFFVHTKTGGNSGFALNNSHRTHSSITNYLKSNTNQNTIPNLLSMSISVNGYNEISNVYFQNGATQNYDGNYDAVCMFSDAVKVPNLYTICDEQIPLSTNGLSLNELKNTTIKVGLRLLQTGNFTINFNNLIGFDSINVYFEDTYTNTTIDLKTAHSYSFDYTAGNSTNRFLLHFIKNKAPQIVSPIGNVNALEDKQLYVYIPYNCITDPDAGDNLTFSMLMNNDKLPKWMTFDSKDMLLIVNATNDEVGNYVVNLRATDKYGAFVDLLVNLNVINTNDAPQVLNQIPNFSIDANNIWTFEVPKNTFIDIDNNDAIKLSATLSNGEQLPSWLVFNSENNTFVGYPTNADAGNIDLLLTASDLFDAKAFDNFSIKVNAITGINYANSDKVNVYPNPSDGKFNIYSDDGEYTFEIIDLSGKQIYIQSSTERINTVDIKTLTPGNYLLKLTYKDNTNIIKILSIK